MGQLYLYSTNPKYSHEIAVKYLNGKHHVWCSDAYNPIGAPSSSPKEIYRMLEADCEHEDTHSSRIKGYKRTLRRLAIDWSTRGIITDQDKDEIIATINSKSWKIWRPQLYIIYRIDLDRNGRLIPVPANQRAAHGDEWKIIDLDTNEFEILEV